MAGQRVGIVGGGISGLAAAWHLVEADPSLQVVVLDSSDRPGGKLRGGLVAGVPTDLGAESVLARRPEGVELAGAVGLADRIVHPAVGTASIWSRGALHPMPAGTLMGVPGTPAAALGVLDADEIARAESERERPHPPVGSDLSVGEFVESRMGPAVVDRLVEPLLGGVYAGHARRLSLQAAVPALWAAALSGESISAVAERAASAAPAARGPVFAGISGGVFELARTLSSVLTSRGVRILSGTTVRAVERTGQGWRLVSGRCPRPSRPSSTPSSSRSRERLPPACWATWPARPDGSSARSPTRRWPSSPWRCHGTACRRCPGRASSCRRSRAGASRRPPSAPTSGRGSRPRRPTCSCCGPRSAGRARRRRCSAPTPSWWSSAAADLSAALGAPLPAPVDSHVQRWGGALPQYTVGHVDRVARIRELVGAVEGLEVAGAAYDGVGVPACIGSGRAAAAATLTHLRSTAAAGRE